MLYYEGLSCPVCGNLFKDGDDVVVCPQCGLPHHRACWAVEMHCHEEKSHGTENQWSRDKAQQETRNKAVTPEETPENTQVCPRCYTKNPEFAEICTHCGNVLHPAEWSANRDDAQPREENYTPYRAPYNSQENRYSPIDRVGEVSAAELAAVVGNNADYYLPRFREIADGKSGGWHWAGFLLGPIWLLYRKQYLLGSFMFVMQMLLSVLTSIFYQPLDSLQTTQEMVEAMMQMTFSPLYFSVSILSTVLFVGRLLLGLRGSDLYYHHCVRTIKSAKQKVPDISAPELSSIGGTSVTLIIVFYIISMMVSSGISALLM